MTEVAPHPPADFLARFSIASKAAAAVGWQTGYAAAFEAAEAAVADKLWRATHTVRGACRYCSTRPPEPSSLHRMSCRFYVGPLEHRWARDGWNGTFGGVDHFCVCGGWFRLGGIAGHGDGTEEADVVCPNADQDWRGPKADVSP